MLWFLNFSTWNKELRKTQTVEHENDSLSHPTNVQQWYQIIKQHKIRINLSFRSSHFLNVKNHNGLSFFKSWIWKVMFHFGSCFSIWLVEPYNRSIILAPKHVYSVVPDKKCFHHKVSFTHWNVFELLFWFVKIDLTHTPWMVLIRNVSIDNGLNVFELFFWFEWLLAYGMKCLSHSFNNSIWFLSSHAASSISKNPKQVFFLLGNPKPNELPNKIYSWHGF